jgi:2-polyprenyl-6-methoxyphenol hydroxylase-like FAD-dependent oxidoreductase
MSENRRVVVIGGGIGGLTTVLALRQAGIEVQAFEQAHNADRTVIGGGMTLFQNAISVLRRLGVEKTLEGIGDEMGPMEHRAANGWRLARWPIEDIARETGYPAIALSRADLQRALVDAVGDGVSTDAKLEKVIADTDGVTAVFADGREERADVLVGADGIRSKVRAELHGSDEPRYLGYAIWQAVIEEPAALGPHADFVAWWGPGSRMGFYRVGGGRVYWYTVENSPPGLPKPESGVREHLLGIARRYEPIATALVEATDPAEISRSDVYDRPPLTQWGKGRVTLLGDAAHAMSFNIGQGACQAIEDAWTLRRHLTDRDDVPQALRAYESEREATTATLVGRARMVGRFGQLAAPLEWPRNLMMTIALRGPAYRQHREAAVRVATD